MQTMGIHWSEIERSPAESNIAHIAAQKISVGNEQVDFMACKAEPLNFPVPLNNACTEVCGEGNCKVRVNKCAPDEINGGCLPSQSTSSMFNNVVNSRLQSNNFSDLISFLPRFCPPEKVNGFHFTAAAVVAFLEERNAKLIEAASTQQRAEYEARYSSQVTMLSSEYEQKVKENEGKVQELSRELQKVSQQRSDSQAQLRSSSSRLSISESEIQNCRTEVQKLHAQLDTETRQTEGLRERILTIQREITVKEKNFDIQLRQSQDAKHANEQEVHRLNSMLKENESVANQLRCEYKKVRDQLAAIEQKSAQESLTSGSYADGHVNPSMLENACKNVDKVIDNMVRVMHDFSITSKASLESPEMESFIGKVSLAKPSDFSRPAQVKHVWGHWICAAMFRGFENVFFGMDGDWASALDFKAHASACFESFQRNRDVSPLEYYEASATFKAFCISTYKCLFPVELLNEGLHLDSVTCDSGGRFGGDEVLYAQFLEVAKAIWLLHALAFAFDPPAGILRMSFGTPFEKQFHEPLINDSDMISNDMSARVVLMVRPAFRVRNSIIRSRVFLSKRLPALQVDSSKI